MTRVDAPKLDLAFLRIKVLAFLFLALCLMAFFPAAAAGASAMQDYAEAMQPGWNLGNTLDATPNETAWGNPPTTLELIQKVKAQGFKSIRIPVTWEPHMGGAPDYKIDPVWMARVKQIVDWSLQEGLYVMLNVHHDSYWILNMPTSHDVVLAKFNAIWTQIAPEFRDHSNKLMFESINEPQFRGVSDATAMALLNELNTSFFHIVRNTGGGNATRPLVLPSLNTNTGQQYLDSLKSTMTALNDSNLIATVHYYGFWPFSVNITGVTTVNDTVKNDIYSSINNSYNTFVAHGIPVVVGELGILNYNPYDGAVERGELLKYFEIYMAAAREKKITWQLWDAGGQFNRYSYQWTDRELFDYYMAGLTGRSATGSSDLVFVNSGSSKDVTLPFETNGHSFVSLTSGDKTFVRDVDYTFGANELTLKKGLLDSIGTGAYGEKATLSVNFSGGLPWNVHVRHQASAVMGKVSGSKADGLVIPATFNGDLVATMQATYKGRGSPFPGPATWTSYQERDATYIVSHPGNRITLKKEFFAATTNDPIDVVFHMWSGQKLNYQLTFESAADVVKNPESLTIYGDSLSSGWDDQSSWAPRNLAETTTVHSGSKSLSISAAGYGAVVLTYTGVPLDTSAYHTLVFWVHGGKSGGQNFGVRIERGSDGTSPGVSIPTPAAGSWRKVEIPLSSLGVEGSPNITRIIFQNWTNAEAPILYVDDVSLTTAYASDLVFVHGNPGPNLLSSNHLEGTRGMPFTHQLVTATEPTSVSVANLPAWLSYDAALKQFSGTPPAAGSFPFSITLNNSVGTITEGMTIQVNPDPVAISFSPNPGEVTTKIEVAYDGASHPVETHSTPAGVPLRTTYNGRLAPPRLPGVYKIVSETQDPNLAGHAEATLVIASSNPGRLVNLSIRARAGSAADKLIVGFVATGGTSESSMLIRGVGPSLSSFGLAESSLLADPRLELFDQDGNSLASNDNWSPSLSTVFAASGAFPLQPDSSDSALVVTTPAGPHSAHISGPAGTNGVVLGEVYDLSTSYSSTAPQLVNVSARCKVGSGAEILIPGFVVGGETPVRVLLRAVGPSLETFHVVGTLPDPRIVLFKGSEAIGSNDNWSADLADAFGEAGAFPLVADSKDAAFVVELAPGGYTAHVQGADGAPGIALVEVYALPGI